MNIFLESEEAYAIFTFQFPNAFDISQWLWLIHTMQGAPRGPSQYKDAILPVQGFPL